MLIFEFVYKEISGRAGKDKDTVTLNYYLAQKWKPDLSRRTYERGINDLLERDFLFRSVVADVYFVNVRYMFNGDRMVVMSVYRRAGSTLQTELPFQPPPTMLDAPNEQSNDESNKAEQRGEQ
jgi:DNA-binding SARP family transcriptional activator